MLVRVRPLVMMVLVRVDLPACGLAVGDGVHQVLHIVVPRSLRPGETLTLTLYWQPQRQPDYDYQVFAQVIDPAWQVWGSKDGRGPGWEPGQVVTETRRITLLPETPPGSYPIQVGLFYSGVGRLPLLAPDGHYVDERVLLGPIRVNEQLTINNEQ